MASTAKFLHPIRQSLTVMSSSCSSFNHFYYGRFYSVKALLKRFQPSFCVRASMFQPSLDFGRHFLRNIHISGKKFSSGAILGMSIAFRPIIAYAMDAGDALVDPFEDSRDVSEEEEQSLEFWKFVKKFWLPVFLLVNVLTNLDNPIVLLFIKVALFLLSTKPNPLSVYVFVDQFIAPGNSENFMFYARELLYVEQCQEFQLHKVKSLYASKVEVQDYKLLCLANVEVRDQKFTLVGILGSWWSLPHLSSEGAFSSLRNRFGHVLV